MGEADSPPGTRRPSPHLGAKSTPGGEEPVDSSVRFKSPKRPESERTPLSRSAVVPSRAGAEQGKEDEPKGEPKKERRDSDPPSFRRLTPYQARLDVEMDDTAISRVRDPSASIKLGPDGELLDQAARLPMRRRSFSLASVALGGTFGAAIVTAAVLLAEHQAESIVAPPAQSGEAPARTAVSAPAGGEILERGVSACILQGAPAPLATRALPGVRPQIMAQEQASSLVVGFAATATRAAGLLVDPATMQAKRFYDATGRRAITDVVPVGGGDRVSFVVDRRSSTTRHLRTVDAAPRFSVRLTPRGLTRFADGDRPRLLFPGISAPMTTPVVATVQGRGHAIVMRRGGPSGQLLVGWTDAHGDRVSDLRAVSAGGWQVGAPAVASGPDGVVIAFSRRMADEKWHLHTVSVPFGQAPETVRTIGDAAAAVGSADAPAITAAGDDRWFVQSARGHEAFAVTLDEKLRGVGKPLRLSLASQRARPGAVHHRRGRAVALYFVEAEGYFELWARALSCD